MQKLAFVITAAVLLAAIGSSVALYTVHIANAQNNMTSAGGAKNMTAGSNMTGAAGNTTGSNMTTGANTTAAHGSAIPTTHPAGNPVEDLKNSVKGFGPLFGGNK